MDINQANDESLIQQYYGCDSNASEILYHRYYQRLYGLSSRFMVGNDVPDMVEDIMVKVLATKDKGSNRFRSDYAKPFEHWIMTIARHHLLDYKRRAKREVLFTELTVEGEDGEEFGPEQWMGLDGEDMELRLSDTLSLARCLAELPEEESAIIELRYIQEKTLEDIAALFNVSPPTIHRIEKRTLAKLRDCFARQALLPG